MPRRKRRQKIKVTQDNIQAKTGGRFDKFLINLNKTQAMVLRKSPEEALKYLKLRCLPKMETVSTVSIVANYKLLIHRVVTHFVEGVSKAGEVSELQKAEFYFCNLLSFQHSLSRSRTRHDEFYLLQSGREKGKIRYKNFELCCSMFCKNISKIADAIPEDRPKDKKLIMEILTKTNKVMFGIICELRKRCADPERQSAGIVSDTTDLDPYPQAKATSFLYNLSLIESCLEGEHCKSIDPQRLRLICGSIYNDVRLIHKKATDAKDKLYGIQESAQKLFLLINTRLPAKKTDTEKLKDTSEGSLGSSDLRRPLSNKLSLTSTGQTSTHSKTSSFKK